MIFSHPFTPLFKHSRESVPPFMSVNVPRPWGPKARGQRARRPKQGVGSPGGGFTGPGGPSPGGS